MESKHKLSAVIVCILVLLSYTKGYSEDINFSDPSPTPYTPLSSDSIGVKLEDITGGLQSGDLTIGGKLEIDPAYGINVLVPQIGAVASIKKNGPQALVGSGQTKKVTFQAQDDTGTDTLFCVLGLIVRSTQPSSSVTVEGYVHSTDAVPAYTETIAITSAYNGFYKNCPSPLQYFYAIPPSTSKAWNTIPCEGSKFNGFSQIAKLVIKSDVSFYCGNVDVDFECAPTVIALASFTAAPGSKAVALTWKTEAEIDNAGFNIYRSDEGTGKYIKINEALIAAEGSATQGSTYNFTDSNVQNRKTYSYKLEDIDLNGRSTLHGPVSATPRLLYGLGK
ncbi:MAG: hypothetical protein WCQ99_10150 [Pseudomonadota bacterium]